jgi:hypothetical protein
VPKRSHRAVDARRQPIEFLLSTKRDTAAARRFFRRVLTQPHTVSTRIKRLVRPGLGFRSPVTASRAIAGYEVMTMIRKRQVASASTNNIKTRSDFIAVLVSIAARPAVLSGRRSNYIRVCNGPAKVHSGPVADDDGNPARSKAGKQIRLPAILAFPRLQNSC